MSDTYDDATLRTLLQEIDASAQDVTAWEAEFINTVLSHTRPLSEKQRAVCDRIREKYLPF